MKKRCYVRAYQKGDALRVAVQKEQKNEAKDFGLFFDEICAYSVVDDEAIEGVFGYVIDEQNEAICYALFSPKIASHLRYLIRFIKKETAFICAQKKVVKVMMTVNKNFVKAKKFAKLLGFCYQRDLPKFYQDEDYQLFERM